MLCWNVLLSTNYNFIGGFVMSGATAEWGITLERAAEYKLD